MAFSSYHSCPNGDDDDLSVNSYEPPPPLCDCRLVLRERVSWSPLNPARRFFNCPNSLKPRRSCRFFVWKDEQVSKHYRDMLHSLRDDGVCKVIKDENGRLKKKVLKLEAEIRAKQAEVKTVTEENVLLKKKLQLCLFIICFAVVAMVGIVVSSAWI